MKKILAYIAVAALAAVAWAEESVVVLRTAAALYEEKDARTVKWSSTVAAGTVLTLRDNETPSLDLYTKEKTYKDVSFYAVYDGGGKKCFIQTRDAAPLSGEESSFGVITENAVLFTKPHPAAFRNAWLEPGTIVAYNKQIDLIFGEITFFDTDDGVRRTRCVQLYKVSTDKNDIKAVQLLEKARSIKDEGLRREFLDSAAKAAEGGRGKIAAYIAAETNRILGISSFSDDDIVQVDEFFARVFTADGSKVNLRSLPGTAGDKVAQAENGWECIATLATEPKETIEGITASWYYVHGDGIEGWLFGGYLQREGDGPEEIPQLSAGGEVNAE